jgi:hypothetical protein
LRVWLVSLVESATFMAVAYQLDRPPTLQQDAAACLVSWGFIVARALTAPVCAMYLATLGKRALVRREMYGNLLLTIGGTIQQIIENLQLAADERLIEPLWRMQVLVDRASRAHSDDEMDRFDDELLKALGELRALRDRLHPSPANPMSQREQVTTAGASLAGSELERPRAVDASDEHEDEVLEEGATMPHGRYNRQRLDDRLAATR